jgi:hypothetical protein
MLLPDVNSSCLPLGTHSPHHRCDYVISQGLDRHTRMIRAANERTNRGPISLEHSGEDGRPYGREIRWLIRERSDTKTGQVAIRQVALTGKRQYFGSEQFAVASRGSMGRQDPVVHPSLDSADAHSERVGRPRGADVLSLIAGVHGNFPFGVSIDRP